MQLKDLPAIGQPLEGGTFAGLTTDATGAHCAVVLLADAPDGEMTWKQAMAWADGIGAALPKRPVSALLFMHLKDQFQKDWYWTGEQYSASLAWAQYFNLGDQGTSTKSAELRARAVRLIQLTT
jgi:hypothetical protein